MASVVTELGLWEPELGPLPSAAHQDARGPGAQKLSGNVQYRPGARVSSQPGAQLASRKTVTDKAGALAFRVLLLTLALPAPHTGTWRRGRVGLKAGGSLNLPHPGGQGSRGGLDPAQPTPHTLPPFPPHHPGVTDPSLAIKGLLTSRGLSRQWTGTQGWVKG